MNKWISIKKFIKYILSILLLAVIFIVLFPRFSGLKAEDILQYRPESLWFAALIIICLYCLKSVIIFIPHIALYISTGVMFPIGMAFLITCIGVFLELAIGYFWGRHLGNKKIAAVIEKNGRIKKFMSLDKNNSLSACFLMRFLPLPITPVSMLYGASTVKFTPFLVFSILGLAPSMIPFIIMADTISTPFSKEFLISFSINTVVCLCAVGLHIMIRRKNKMGV